MSASNVFAKIINDLLRLIGLGKKSYAEILSGQIAGWTTQKTALHDEVELLKEQIREMDGRLRAKNSELKASSGETTPIIEEEIRSLFHELDARKRKQEVLFGGINRLNTVIGQAEQALQTGAATVSAEQVRELEVQFKTALMDLRETDREVRRLDETNYQRIPTAVANYDVRRAALDQATTAQPAATAQPSAVAPVASTLSDAERKRLASIAQTND